MPGLSFTAGAGVRAGVPTPALAPSSSGSTIGQQAFGVTSGAPAQAGGSVYTGAMAVGIGSMAFLVWLYYSLPH